jgi:hypothetical protein
MAGGRLLKADSTQVGISPGGAVEAAVGSQLTDRASGEAVDAARQAIAACARSTSSAPDTCPQYLFAFTSVTWQTVGDQVQDASVQVSTDQSGLLRVDVTARYAMIASYQSSSYDGKAQGVAAGFYTATLERHGSAFAVSALHSASGTPARPAGATDQAALDAVKAALQACAASASPRPANCPQYLFLFFGSGQNVKWTLMGDPTAGATVAFDQSGVVTVQGRYAMDVAYDSSGQRQTSHDEGPYTAELLWDGDKLVLGSLQR